ncbi:MAG: GNAT family N-acetyltransferase [Planctomycetes bacterium]|nr:GNAT family N-acetyltransferase [Planctomycetota bacterium]
MHVTRLAHIDECRHAQAGWDNVASTITFRRSAWLQSWWRYYQADRELYVLHVTDDRGETVGITPWFIEQSVGKGRVIRPLGCGEVCSDHVGIMATAGREEQVLSALVKWLARAAAGDQEAADRWDLLDLVACDVEDRVTSRFVQQLDGAGCRVHKRPALGCWMIALPDDWETYVSSLHRIHRKQVRGLQRKWLDSGKARLHTIERSEDLEGGMSILIDLHQRRRMSLGDAGCFASDAFRGFLHEAAARLLAENLLRLHWLEVGGRPVAADIQILAGDTVYAYQAGMEPEAADIGPGQIIQTATLKIAIEDGRRVFDFLRGDETYKSHWQARRHECVDYRVVAPRPTSNLRHQMWLAGDTMKQWIKLGLQLTGMH